MCQCDLVACVCEVCGVSEVCVCVCLPCVCCAAAVPMCHAINFTIALAI